MSIANFPLAGAAISQPAAIDDGKKTPPKRRITAKRDAAVLPEPR